MILAWPSQADRVLCYSAHSVRENRGISTGAVRPFKGKVVAGVPSQPGARHHRLDLLLCLRGGGLSVRHRSAQLAAVALNECNIGDDLADIVSELQSRSPSKALCCALP